MRYSYIESDNPEKMATGLTDMSDVINPEQESPARETEAAISEWIRSQYKYKSLKGPENKGIS